MFSSKRNYIRALSAVGLDIFSLFLAFLAAYWVRFSEILIPAVRGIPPLGEYFRALPVVLLVFLWVFRSYGLYQFGRHVRRVEEIFTVLKGIGLGTLILMSLTFFYRGYSYSRLFLAFLFFFAALWVGLFRYVLIQWLYRLRLQAKDLYRILIVGTNRNARNLIVWAQQNPHLGYQIEGVLSRERELIGKHLEGAQIIGTIEQCEDFIKKLHPQEVVVADSKLPREKLAELLLRCENELTSFKVAADLYGMVTSNLAVEYVATVPLLGVRPLPLDDPWNRILKRTLDLGMSAILLVICSPVFLLAAAVIKLTDRGPVFYRQERVGQDGRHFLLYKFRTMRTDAEKRSGPVWARKGDDRCTPAGQFLRRFNLDELPQFWNVLKGEMSLVGPRPERPHFVKQFRGEIPRYMARHKIKSGITGWAQVNGLRGNTSLQERIKYDLYYAENWSVLLDLEILFMTLFAFKNAY